MSIGMRGDDENRIYVVRETLPGAEGPGGLARYRVMHGNRRIGYVNPGKTDYFSHRSETKHFSFKLQAYGIDKPVVDWLDTVDSLERVVLVITHADGRQRAYITPVFLWLFNAREVTLSPDFGPQVFVRFADIVAADEHMRQSMNVWQDGVAQRHFPPVEAIEVPA